MIDQARLNAIVDSLGDPAWFIDADRVKAAIPMCLYWAKRIDGKAGKTLTPRDAEEAVVWLVLMGLTLHGLLTERFALVRALRAAQGQPAPQPTASETIGPPPELAEAMAYAEATPSAEEVADSIGGT